MFLILKMTNNFWRSKTIDSNFFIKTDQASRTRWLERAHDFTW